MLRDFAARLRNVITIARQTRRDGAKVQVQTRHGRVVSGTEAFPYGFMAKSPSGTAVVLFEAGDMRRPTILPVGSVEGAPQLEDGDAALWTAGGGWIVARAGGTIELSGTEFGGLVNGKTLRTELQKNSTILQSILTVLKTPITEPGAGAPSALQAALNTALIGQAPGNWSHIENEAVVHGDGTH